jgi:hypothetical protein
MVFLKKHPKTKLQFCLRQINHPLERFLTGSACRHRTQQSSQVSAPATEHEDMTGLVASSSVNTLAAQRP